LGSTKSNVLLKLSPNSLGYDGQNLPLINEGFEQKCLQLLTTQRSFSLAEMIRSTFNIISDEFAYERLRIAILRLNKKLATLTGLPKTILHTKLKVSLHPEVEIFYSERDRSKFRN